MSRVITQVDTPYSPGSIQDIMIKGTEGRHDAALIKHILLHGPGKHLETAMMLAWNYPGAERETYINLTLGVVQPEGKAMEDALRRLHSSVANYFDQVDPRWEKVVGQDQASMRIWNELEEDLTQDLTNALQALQDTLAGTSLELRTTTPVSRAYLRPCYSSGPIDSRPRETPRSSLGENMNSVLRHMAKKFIHQTLLVSNTDHSKTASSAKPVFKATSAFDISILKALEKYSTDEKWLIVDALHSLQKNNDMESDHLDLFLEHFPALTWGSMLELGKLIQEYNVEWALAAHEWNPQGYSYPD